MFGQSHIFLWKGKVIVSAAAWQGDDMQAETSTVTVAQLLMLLTQCRANRSLNRKDPI